jgi:hypothetical protein
MFRFTIRDVLWLTALVGALAGWWVDRSRLDIKLARHHEAVENLAKRLSAATGTNGFWIPGR